MKDFYHGRTWITQQEKRRGQDLQDEEKKIRKIFTTDKHGKRRKEELTGTGIHRAFKESS